MDSVIATLWAGKTFDQTAISPDGKQVAWVENSKDGSAIFISPDQLVELRAALLPVEAQKVRSHGLPIASRLLFSLTPAIPASLSFMLSMLALARHASLPA